MSNDQQMRDRLVAAAAQPRHAPDLDQITHRARRRRNRRRAAYAGSTGIIAASLTAIAVALPNPPTGPTIDELRPAPIALLAEQDHTVPSDGESILDRLGISHDPGRTRTLDQGQATLVVTTSHRGTQTCLYARPAPSALWSGGCKPTLVFLDDGWLLLTIQTDGDTPTTLTAILTRDDVTQILTASGSLAPANNLTVTDHPVEGELHATHPTNPLPTITTDRTGTIVR